MNTVLIFGTIGVIAAQTTLEVPGWVSSNSPVAITGVILWWFMQRANKDRDDLLKNQDRAITAIERFTNILERIEKRLPETIHEVPVKRFGPDADSGSRAHLA